MLTPEQKYAFLKTFSNVDAGDVKRRRLAIFAKKASEADSEFEYLGYKVEEMSISNNYENEEMEDVRGDKYNDINGKAESIEMSACRFNKNHSQLAENGAMMALSGLEDLMNDYIVLIVAEWRQNEAGAMWGRQIEGCRLTVDNIGQSSYCAGDCTFSGIGDGDVGTVTITDKKPVFTKYTPAATAE